MTMRDGLVRPPRIFASVLLPRYLHATGSARSPRNTTLG
jgi:hypothetical protein